MENDKKFVQAISPFEQILQACLDSGVAAFRSKLVRQAAFGGALFGIIGALSVKSH